MATAKRMLGSSLVASFVLNHYAPSYAVAHSYLWTAVVLFVVQFLSWGLYTVILYPAFLSPLRHLPEPPGASLINGHASRILKEPSGAPFREWVEHVPNDGLIRYKFLFNKERVLLTSPKALGEVLVTKNYEFIKPPHLRSGLGRILGIGILLAEGEEHKRQRKLLSPAFAFRHVKDLYPLFWSKSIESVAAMTASIKQASGTTEKPSNIIEIGNWASRATLDIIGLAGMFLPFWLLKRLPVKRNDEIEAASNLIKRTCYDLVQAKKAKMAKGERTDNDILSVALESGGFSDEDLVNQLMTFLAAGHETTASSMSWAIYCLCQHPDVQRRLREEVRSHLPSITSPTTSITAADIDALPYLSAVCNEVLRLWSPVPMTLRVAAADATILGQFIPAGTTVIIAPWATNTSTQLWGPTAKEFDPDRWMGEGQAHKGGADSNYSFLTFLHGPRSCIGQGFAKAEFACLLAAWVGRFEMELANPDMVVEIKGGIMSKPKDGLEVKMNVLEGW
ncbi:cytochrome P450 [Cryomyces antarcticus]